MLGPVPGHPGGGWPAHSYVCVRVSVCAWAGVGPPRWGAGGLRTPLCACVRERECCGSMCGGLRACTCAHAVCASAGQHSSWNGMHVSSWPVLLTADTLASSVTATPHHLQCPPTYPHAHAHAHARAFANLQGCLWQQGTRGPAWPWALQLQPSLQARWVFSGGIERLRKLLQPQEAARVAGIKAGSLPVLLLLCSWGLGFLGLGWACNRKLLP